MVSQDDVGYGVEVAFYDTARRVLYGFIAPTRQVRHMEADVFHYGRDSAVEYQDVFEVKMSGVYDAKDILGAQGALERNIRVILIRIR